MAKLSLKRVRESLKQVQKIGQLEETFTVCGVSVTLRSIGPLEHQECMQEINAQEFTNAEAVMLMALPPLSRSIVEVGDLNLRDFDFVEVPDPSDESKVLTLERSEFIKDYILATWTYDVVRVAYTKYTELRDKELEVALEGVTFSPAGETPEAKYRRMLAEINEVEEELPIELVNSILNNVGYMKKTTALELAEAFTPSTEKAEPLEEEELLSYEEPEKETLPPPSVEAMLVNRKPLNLGNVAVPTIPTVTPEVTLPKIAVRPGSKAELYAKLEGEVGLPMETQLPSTIQRNVTTLEQPLAKRDFSQAVIVGDQPSPVSVNRRFRPQPR